MVERVFKFLNKDMNGLHEAAFVLGISAFFSQVLALARDRLFAGMFGTSETLDIYYASFRVPDLIYVFVASLVASAILIPLVVEKMERGEKEEIRKFLNSILTFFLLALVVVSIGSYFILPYVADIIVPGFSDESKELFVGLSRVLLLSPLFLGLSNLFGSVTQSLRRFTVYALTPIVYNIGIIVGILYFYGPYGIYGLGYGVILGALLHFLVQVPSVLKEGLLPFPTIRADMKEVGRVIALSLPRTLSLGMTHIVIIIFTAVASFFSVGSITVFNFAYNLQSVPLAIIGVSYSVAAFPTLARLFSNGDKTEFVRHIATAGRHIIFWSLPVLALFIVLRAQIVRSILGTGAFDWTDTSLTAAALALFSFSVVAQGLTLLFIRGYYAAGNTKKPLIVNVVSALASILFAYILLYFFDARSAFRLFFEEVFRVEGFFGTKVLMLPLAFSLGSLLNLFLLWGAFKRDFRPYYVSIRKSVFKSLAGTLVIGFIAYGLLQFFDDIFNINTIVGIFSQGFFAGLGALAVGAVFFELIRDEEFIDFRKSITARIFRVKPVLPGPEDM